MIRHSLRRRPGGSRYGMTDRQTARALADAGLSDTLSSAARAAMTDPAGIETVVDVLFERESNRLRRPVTVRLLGKSSGGTITSVGVDDPIQSLDDVVSTRHNPSRIYGVADVTVLDSGVVTHDRGPGEELPVAIKRDHVSGALTLSPLSPNPSGALDPAVTGAKGQLLTPTGNNVNGAPSATNALRSTNPADAGRLIPGTVSTAVWYSASVVKGGTLQYQTRQATTYVVPASGVLRFTVGYDVATTATDLSAAGEVSVSISGTLTGQRATSIATPLVAGQVTRILTTVDVTATPGSIVTSLTPVARIRKANEYTNTVRLEVANLHAYVGEPRPFAEGLRTVVPDASTGTPGVELTYPSPIHANRVEVSGEQRLGQVTGVRVEVAYPDAPTTWREAGRAAGSGRLSVPLAAYAGSPDDQVVGVRVWIDETTGGEGSPVYVQEVDVLFLDDVSDDLAGLDVRWSREADPGVASAPFGNYQASTLDLELDNTAGQWNPATNTSLDVGHRVEVGIGVRYGNVLENPRGETDASDWSGAIVQTDTLPGSPPYCRGFLLTGTAQSTPVALLPEATSIRVGGWVRAAAGSTVTLRAQLRDAGGTTTAAGNPAATTTPETWEYVTSTRTVADPSLTFGYALVDPGSNGAATLLVLEQLDAAGNVLEVEEVLSGGVFYTEPYDTDSRSPTVSIAAVDRLGRLRSVAVDEEVRVGQDVARIVRDLALRYLDLDVDGVVIGPTPGGYVVPYAYAAGGDVGTYLADLAKATVSTLHVDALERLRLTRRNDASPEVALEIRADNALIGHRRPPGIDVTTSAVTVNATPLAPGEILATLFELPSGGITVPASSEYELVAPYSSTPATDAAILSVVADGNYTILASRFGSHRARVTIRNDETRTLAIANVVIAGNTLVEQPLSARLEHGPSVARYGPRELTVDARLIQTQSQVEAVAEVLLDTFRSIDDAGVRRIPDLTLDALGILCLEAGDRIALSDSRNGLSGDYAILSRTLSYAGGALLLNDVRVREANDVTFAVVGESQLDTGVVAGY